MKKNKPFKKKRKVSRRRWRVNPETWRKVNHKRTAAEIAEELEVTVQAVYRAAKRYGFEDELVSGRKVQAPRVDWEHLPRTDWEMTNADLGRKHDVTREIVRRKRHKYAPDDLKESPRK